VDGILAEAGTWYVMSVLWRIMVDVAVIAARATVCANVIAVGDPRIGAFAATFAPEAYAALGTGTCSAGLRLASRVGSFLQVLKCLRKPEAAVVAKRRWQ
jgi:hypothetical protein